MSHTKKNPEVDCWNARYYTSEPRPEEVRKPTDIDMARIIHSAAFRRMQGKTQILGLGDGDFYRTRLTHSIEVAQIASGIVRQLSNVNIGDEVKNLLPEIPLIAAISLGHDIGHPPFGHGGEIALNFLMRDHGGFEGNAQTLRLVHLLDTRSRDGGLNLTRRTLLGLLKYPVRYSDAKRDLNPMSVTGALDFTKIKVDDWKPPKCYYDEENKLVDWILKPLPECDREVFSRVKNPSQYAYKKSCYKSLDASIMDIADDIAYGVHDLEDAIAMNLLNRDAWDKASEKCFDDLPPDVVEKLLSSGDEKLTGKEVQKRITEKLFNTSESWQRKDAIGSLVHTLITSVQIKLVEGFSTNLAANLLRFNARLSEPTKNLLTCLQNVVSDKVIKSSGVQTLEYRGLRMVAELFQTFLTNPDRLLPEKTREKIKERGVTLHRGIADHIACMTDEYATKMYERLFVPREGTIHQRL